MLLDISILVESIFKYGYSATLGGGEGGGVCCYERSKIPVMERALSFVNECEINEDIILKFFDSVFLSRSVYPVTD